MKQGDNIVLVLGGARSGKSEFAEKFVLHAGALCGYVATAEILDDEMRERVALHQAGAGNAGLLLKRLMRRRRSCRKREPGRTLFYLMISRFISVTCCMAKMPLRVPLRKKRFM